VRRRSRAGCGVASAALVLLGAISPTSAFGALRPAFRRSAASLPLAVLRDGVVWVDQGRVLFQGFRAGEVTLGGMPASSTPILAASDNAVALVGAGAGFAGGVPPARLTPVEGVGEEVREFAGGECSVWSPKVGSTAEAPSDFAVADGELLDMGECQAENGGFDEQELASAQPLFVHRLHGGGWRILRWVKGHQPPILATERNLLAIGEPVSDARMRVTILDLARRALVAQFRAPLGDLGFASSRRLVLSVPAFPEHAVSSRTASAASLELVKISYRLQLYTLNGQPLAYLGTVGEPALVSHMHLLVNEDVEGHSVLAVRNILDGSSRRLIGFNEPARALEAVGFRWPAAALLETTSAPLQQSEVTCVSGEYHRAKPPLLRIFDLARPESYVPPPPSAHLAPPVGPCRPRPVYAKG
jgi:hypothetical protein